jgi:hypothetical protein
MILIAMNTRRNTKHQDPNTQISSKHQAPKAMGGLESRMEAVDLEWSGLVGAFVLHDGDRHPFDLEERTAVFGERIVRLCKKVPLSPVNHRLIDQLGGAGTRVGANYREATERVKIFASMSRK